MNYNMGTSWNLNVLILFTFAYIINELTSNSLFTFYISYFCDYCDMQNFLLICLQNNSNNFTEKLGQVDFEGQVDLILHFLTEIKLKTDTQHLHQHTQHTVDNH